MSINTPLQQYYANMPAIVTLETGKPLNFPQVLLFLSLNTTHYLEPRQPAALYLGPTCAMESPFGVEQELGSAEKIRVMTGCPIYRWRRIFNN